MVCVFVCVGVCVCACVNVLCASSFAETDFMKAGKINFACFNPWYTNKLIHLV